MSRKTTDDERKLFRKIVAETAPKAVIPKAGAPAKTPKSGALDGNTSEKLRRGQLQPQARIDLHGLTEAAAHRALLSFLAQGQRKGLRLVLAITGVGNPAGDEAAEWMRSPHGVLKEMVPRWLNESEFVALVSGWAVAHRRHGGEGALYVYLRRGPQAAKR
jgi:DNA-nicking Smr family endonuclease